MKLWITILTGWLLATTITGHALGATPQSETELERLARRLTELETRNAELERQMARRGAELEKYRTGLEKAITELNRARGRQAGPQRAPSPAASPPRRRSALELANHRLLSSPRTRLKGREVTVSGEVLNPHRQGLQGVLVVELLRDGMPIDELRQPFEIPARGRLPYSQTFALIGYAAGSYSARVGFAY